MGSESVFGPHDPALGLLEPTRIVSVVVYIYLPFFILFRIFKYTVELWIRLGDDNLRRAIEWEEKHLAYPYFSDREIAKRVTNENGDNDDTA